MALPITSDGMAVYVPDGAVLNEWFWDRNKLSVIQGPIGSGTSTAGCHRIVVLADEQEADLDGVRRTRWIISRDTYKELRETTIKTWLEWFPEDVWGPLMRSEPMFHHLKYEHPSGDGTKVDCEVIFLAVPDPDVAEQVLASYEITGFFRNEGQFCEKPVIDEFLSRCARYPSMKNGPGATWYGGWIDLNAPPEGHWIPYMRGDMPLPPEMGDDEKAGFTKPDDWAFYVQPPGLIEANVEGKTVYYENPLAENQSNLKESYLDKIKGKLKPWIDRRVINKVGLQQHGKPVYPTFNEEEHINKVDVPPRDGYSIIVGMDFGREPAAAFLQEIGGCWVVLSELIGDNEPASKFAPRVKRHLAQRYGGFAVEFWGDPRGDDGAQNNEITAYDIFLNHDMRVLKATNDNSPEVRRSTMEMVFNRRHGFKVNPSCLMTKRAFAGGYHFRKIKGMAGVYAPQPVKNVYSHIAESVENGVIGGGEGHAMVSNTTKKRAVPSPVKRNKVRLRRGRA